MSENFSRLTVVRHGQSTWNKLQKVQGQNDEAQLTAEGRAMARAVATDLAPHSFSRIISSDLQRARQTAAIIADVLGLEVTHDERLRERSYGILETGPSSGVTPELSGLDLVAQRVVNVAAKPDGGESLREMYERTTSFLTELLRDGRDDRALLVSHGGPIRTMLLRASGVDLDGSWWLPVSNCSCWPLGDSYADALSKGPLPN